MAIGRFLMFLNGRIGVVVPRGPGLSRNLRQDGVGRAVTQSHARRRWIRNWPGLFFFRFWVSIMAQVHMLLTNFAQTASFVVTLVARGVAESRTKRTAMTLMNLSLSRNEVDSSHMDSHSARSQSCLPSDAASSMHDQKLNCFVLEGFCDPQRHVMPMPSYAPCRYYVGFDAVPEILGMVECECVLIDSPI